MLTIDSEECLWVHVSVMLGSLYDDDYYFFFLQEGIVTKLKEFNAYIGE